MKMRKLVVAGVILLVLLMVYLFSGYNNGSNDAGNDPQRRTVANAAPLSARADNPAPHNAPADASGLRVRVFWADDRSPAEGTTVTLTALDDSFSTQAIAGPLGLATFDLPEGLAATSSTARLDARLEATRAYAFPTSMTLPLSQPQSVEVTLRKAYAVFGTVYMEDASLEKLPLAGATVSSVGLTAPLATATTSTTTTTAPVATTDAAGRYRLVSPEPVVRLLATAGAVVSSPNPENTVAYTLAHDQDNGPRDIILREKAALVLSVVAKETLEPIAGAVLEIETQPTSTTLVTDGEGFCELSGLEPGMLRVSARADGFAKQITFVNILPATANAAVLYLGPAGEVHVYTVDPDGNPVPEVLVDLWMANVYNQPLKLDRLQTDPEGHGVFRNVSRGPHYYLNPPFLDTGIYKYFDSCTFTFDETDNPIAEVTLVIISEKEVNRDPLRGNGNLRGRVIDPHYRPVAGLSLSLGSAGKNPYEPQQTDAKGEFEYTDLPENGERKLLLTVSGIGYKPIKNHEVHPGTFVELTILPSVSLRGRVVDVGTSQPIQSFVLKVLSSSSTVDHITNGLSMYSSDGSFQLDTIYPEDRAVIVVEADGYSQKETFVHYDNLPEELIIPMTPKGPLVKGMIMDEVTGLPVAGAFVGVYEDNGVINITPEWRDYLNVSAPLKQHCSLSAYSGVEGEFKFDVEQTDATLFIYSNFHGLHLFTINHLPSISSPKDQLVIKLPKASSLTVECQFAYQDGFKLPNVDLYRRIDVPVGDYGMHYQGIFFKDFMKSSSNTFKWDNIPAGEYTVAMSLAGVGEDRFTKESVSAAQLKTIISGEAASINFALPASRLSGRATLSGEPFQGRFIFSSQAEINHEYPTYRCLVISDAEGVYGTPWIGQGIYTLEVYNAHPENPQPPPPPPPPIEIKGVIRMDFSF